jgi:hypothetical protein
VRGFIPQLILQVQEGSLLSSPPPTVRCRQGDPPFDSSFQRIQRKSIFAIPVMGVDGGKIDWECPLVPLAPMPFGIVCTLTKYKSSDGGGLLHKNRLTIIIPLWDENDVPFYNACLAIDRRGIILSMPATASFLRNIENVAKVNNMCFNGDTQVALQHNVFCNSITESGMRTGREGITRVLLLFPKGQTFNNASYNKGTAPGDRFTLERKNCIFTEMAKNKKEVIRVAVAFEAAMDTGAKRDVPAVPNAAAVDDEVSALLNKLGMGGAEAGL